MLRLVRSVKIQAVALLLTTLMGAAYAGGPLYTFNGNALRWRQGTPIALTLDQGKLGQLTNEEAQALVRTLLRQWELVPTAAVRFTADQSLPNDVTTEAEFNTAADNFNPVIFDADGALIDDIEGEGSSQFIIGFAGHSRFEPRTAPTELAGAFVVMNGKFAKPNGTARDQENFEVFKTAIVHELGHLLGMDHTQAGLEYVGLLSDQVPLMYPIAINNAPLLLLDDVTWISWLYPGASFGSGQGSIRGKVFRSNGVPMTGANVLLRAVSNITFQNIRLLSVVSGYLRQEGEWEIPAVPPGDYHVLIEPISPGFTGGSSVGPLEAPFRSFPLDFYNGANESGDSVRDDPAEKVVVTIVAGSSPPLVNGAPVSEINLYTNELPNNLTALSDDDSVEYVFPSNFKFPFFGTQYGSLYVNSDGNLTFGAPDAASTDRNVNRLTSGPPRIAPLFTDLDPGQGGRVAYTQTDTSVTLTWRSVPEFDGNDGNTFSVTLLSNGDIHFNYPNIRVTDDTGSGASIQVVVGISSGGANGGSQVLTQDFSNVANGQVVLAGNGSYVESFSIKDGKSFDIEGRQIRFIASQNPATAAGYHFYFPFYRGDQNLYTGFAFANSSDAVANATARAWDSSGALMALPANPSTLFSVPAKQQTAKIAGQIFAVVGDPLQNGWVEIESNNSRLSSLFQIGDRPGRALDGGLAFRQLTSELVLPRIASGPATFAGRDATTTLNFINPNATPIAVFLRHRFQNGGASGPQIRRDIPARGFLQEKFSTLFTSAAVDNGYITISATGGGLIAFELIEAGDTLLAINAVTPSSEKQLYSAQLASGTFGATAYYTSLNLINTASNSASITIRAIDNAGVEYARKDRILLPRQSLLTSLDELLELQGQPRVGTLVVECNQPGLIGDVVFGETKGEFAAGLVLQDVLVSDTLFNHVANGELDGANRNLSYYTGLAFYNPNSVDVEVGIEVFNSSGVLVGTNGAPLRLRPRERTSQLVRELVPAASSQVGGYVRIKVAGNLGVVTQLLYGNDSGRFLSAVPPEVLATAALR